jgi:hypothetical protein
MTPEETARVEIDAMLIASDLAVPELHLHRHAD